MSSVSDRLPPSNRDVFVVRRWRNPADGSWRSQIVHVGSGEVINFVSDAELLAYIRLRLRAQAYEVKRFGLR